MRALALWLLLVLVAPAAVAKEGPAVVGLEVHSEGFVLTGQVFGPPDAPVLVVRHGGPGAFLIPD